MQALGWLLMSNLGGESKSPYFLLIAGFVFVSLGVYGTLNGGVWVRFSGWVYRDKEPKTFWVEVALYYLIGVCFLKYSLLIA